jgi:hypothetical protein
MRKLIYLFLALLIVACSSDDSNNNNINQNLVGAWMATPEDSDTGSTFEQTLVLNSDGTGSVSNLFPTETWFSELTWSTTSTVITVTTLIDNKTESADYELSNNNNTFVLSRDNGIDVIYTRI